MSLRVRAIVSPSTCSVHGTEVPDANAVKPDDSLAKFHVRGPDYYEENKMSFM